jgi:hypothetical protein
VLFTLCSLDGGGPRKADAHESGRDRRTVSGAMNGRSNWRGAARRSLL